MEYSRKSSLKWILTYLIIGLFAYGAIYYFFLNNGGKYMYTSQSQQSRGQHNQAPGTKALTNQSSDWTTYTSDNNYFSVSWPSGWTITTDENNYGIILVGKEGSFNIAWNGLGGMCDEDKIKQFTVGEDFSWICNMDADGLYYSASISKTLNHDIGIGVIPFYRGTTDSDRALFLKVLKSIALNPLAKITTWKTYVNNEYGFEIKYPANWVNVNYIHEGGDSVQFISPSTELIIKNNERACSDNNDATICNPDGDPIDINLIISPKTTPTIAYPQESNGTVSFNGIIFTKYIGAFVGEQHFVTTHGNWDFDFTCIDMGVCIKSISTFKFTK